MTAPPPVPRYCAYLLRCWQEAGPEAGAGPDWRFSLEDPRTGARRGFATWDALIACLHAELGATTRDTEHVTGAGAAGHAAPPPGPV